MLLSERLHTGAQIRIEELTSADDEEMLALAQATEPGPFAIRTRELGIYLGIHDGTRLVAMAGEQIRLAGYTEIGAVCIAPGYRGRGFATALTAELAARISGAGDTPFLHVADDNEQARRIYHGIGFRTRRMLDVLIVAPSVRSE